MSLLQFDHGDTIAMLRAPSGGDCAPASIRASATAFQSRMASAWQAGANSQAQAVTNRAHLVG